MQRSPFLTPERWALALLFVLMLLPMLDMPVSTLFYLPETQFHWKIDGLPEIVRQLVPDLIIASVVVCGLLCAVGRFARRHLLYLVTTMLIGPGLIVEAILKPNWGRARPKDITAFGGDAAYTWPWQIAHECVSNCSFVSGHAAIAFWLTAYAFVAPAKWRPAVMAAALLFGFLVGVVRIAQGGHFLSDVIAAGFIVVLVNTLLARALLKPAVA